MKTYLNRRVVVGEQEVTRNVIEKNGVATVKHQGQAKEVTPMNGNPLDRSTKWQVKK